MRWYAWRSQFPVPLISPGLVWHQDFGAFSEANSGFANSFNAPFDCVVGATITFKARTIESIDIALNALDVFHDVIEERDLIRRHAYGL